MNSIKFALALLVLIGELSLGLGQCTAELNVAYGGTDLSYKISTANTVGSCCLDCCANPACMSYTYDMINNKCTLKSTGAIRVRMTNFIGTNEKDLFDQRSVIQRF